MDAFKERKLCVHNQILTLLAFNLLIYEAQPSFSTVCRLFSIVARNQIVKTNKVPKPVFFFFFFFQLIYGANEIAGETRFLFANIIGYKMIIIN